jgi:2-oxoglutarate dehydrogenase complex dehydrogenase (E1) component-like enzyme
VLAHDSPHSNAPRDVCIQDIASGTRNALDPHGSRTGLPLETLQAVGTQLTLMPEHMQLHTEVETLLKRRREMVASADSRVDFAFAELLAYGTLSLRRPLGAPHPSHVLYLSSRSSNHRCCTTRVRGTPE